MRNISKTKGECFVAFRKYLCVCVYVSWLNKQRLLCCGSAEVSVRAVLGNVALWFFFLLKLLGFFNLFPPLPSFQVGDLVLIILDERHDNYVLFTVSPTLYFLHSESLAALDLKPGECGKCRSYFQLLSSPTTSTPNLLRWQLIL